MATQTNFSVDGDFFPLAQAQDVPDLKQQCADALHSGGGWVDFLVAGNRAMSVMVNTATRLTLTSVEVLDDPRDGDDTEHRHGSGFDWEH